MLDALFLSALFLLKMCFILFSFDNNTLLNGKYLTWLFD